MADESLTLEGRKYVSSGRAGRLYGYTKDYVGQLCRAGKLDAQLIGRSWYVSEDSIRKHKLGVHYTLKNPQKTRSVNIKKNENASSKKAFSDDSREMLPRYEGLSRDEEPVSVHTVQQLPHYAEIPAERADKSSSLEDDLVDLFPVPRRHSGALDPLSRSDIRYEAQEAMYERDIVTSPELEGQVPPLQQDVEHTGMNMDIVRSVPIRSQRQRLPSFAPSVSGVRSRPSLKRKRVSKSHIQQRISDSDALNTVQRRERQRTPIDGVLTTSTARPLSRGRDCSAGHYLSQGDPEEQYPSKYGHRPLSYDRRDSPSARDTKKSYAVPVLGSMIVFAAFVLLYLLFV